MIKRCLFKRMNNFLDFYFETHPLAYQVSIHVLMMTFILYFRANFQRIVSNCYSQMLKISTQSSFRYVICWNVMIHFYANQMFTFYSMTTLIICYSIFQTNFRQMLEILTYPCLGMAFGEIYFCTNQTPTSCKMSILLFFIFLLDE